MATQARSQLLDILKGIAILAVIFYHSGLFTYGYLGVEIFLVIGGFVITKSILRSYDKEEFSYLSFMSKRLVRLWPLLLLCCIISLIGGYFWMLPEPMKNTAETVVGTSTFTNNFVQMITSSDYWDQNNSIKPLMHTWYVGVIFQFYIFYPLVFMLAYRFSSNWKQTTFYILSGIFIASILLYILPVHPTPQKFYMLPARLFEFAAGGMLAIPTNFTTSNRNRTIGIVSSIILLLLLMINVNLTIEEVRLLATVGLTALLIYLFVEKQPSNNSISLPFLPLLGAASFSLYLCHQIILAFYRYAFNFYLEEDYGYFITIGLSLIIGLASYFLLEKPLGTISKTKRSRIIINSLSAVIALGFSAYSIKIYRQHGIVRNIPELDQYVGKQNIKTQDYNDAINHNYDKDFEENGEKNVLVVGDSFARDWANVLLESHAIDSMNLSYCKTVGEKLCKRIEKADYIFFTVNSSYPYKEFGEYLPQMMTKKFYFVGTKNWGYVIGNIYNNDRYGAKYYSQTVKIPKSYIERNISDKAIFGDKYIDILGLFQNKQGEIPMFTPSKKFYTHDGLHLTKPGAKALAELIDIFTLMKN